MTDGELPIVERARGGDRAAFEELVRRTSRLVFAALYLECGDGAKAEDLLQDTYLLALRSIRRLSEPAHFRAWLLAIARNALVADVRKNARLKRAAPTSPLVDVPADVQSPGAGAEREEARQRVLSALRSLPDEYRLPLSLRYLAGSDYETIGTQLGLTNGALRGLLYRGLKQLKDRLPADLI